MSEKYDQNIEPDIKKMVFMSLAFHAAIMLVFTVKMAFFPTEIPKYQPAIRVDLIGLPDKRNPDKPIVAPKPEQKKETHIEKPKETEKKVEKVEPKNTTKSQTAALNKLKTLSAIEKLKKMAKKEKTSSDAPAKEIVKGNVLSVGTALRGLNKIEFDQYISSLDAHVKNNWSLPEWMLSQGYTAQVLVKIDDTGQIIERRFIVKSGNSDFDDRVMAALEKSNPFPAPPEKFIDMVGIAGITFAFPE